MDIYSIVFALTLALKNQNDLKLSFGSSFPIWILRIMQIQPLGQGHLLLVAGFLAVPGSSCLPGFVASPRPLSILLIFRFPPWAWWGWVQGCCLYTQELGGTGIVVREPNLTPSFKD